MAKQLFMSYLRLVSLLIISCIFSTAASGDIVNNSGGPIAPPDNDSVGAFSTINIAENELISQVHLSIFGANHTWVGDLHVTLTGPGGVATVFSRTGSASGTGVGDSSNLFGDYSFADGGADWWFEASERSDNEALTPGTYQPTENTGSISMFGDVFAGTLTAGDWILFISDNSPGDTGGITGWGLTIQSQVIPEPGVGIFGGLLALAVLCCRHRRE